MKRRIRVLSLTFAFSLMMFTLTLAGPLSASASTQSAGRAAGHKEAPAIPHSLQSVLTYHGGPVVTGTANLYAIFWEPTGSSVSSTYNSLLQRFFTDVGGTPFYSILQQYGDASGNHPQTAVLAGTFVDTRSYPANPLLDSDIQNEISYVQSVTGWSSDIHNLFFVFTAQGENECIDSSQSTCAFTSYCGYHNFFGSNTVYAFIPYTGSDLSACGVPSSPNNDMAADSSIDVASFELADMVTDPLFNAWYNNANGDEISDECAYSFGPTNQANGDVFLQGDPYEIQQEWDNSLGSCSLG